jgi:hypothetical protein
MSQRDCFDWSTIQLHNKEALEKLRPYVGDKLIEKFKEILPEQSDFDVLEPCEDDTAQYQKTNFIPPTWASEMNKDKPAVTLMDEYRIENGKAWHNGK